MQQGTELVRYENARRAMAELQSVDEVRTIRNKAKAMQVYAAQAKDTELIDRATEIRLRAERRAGELLRNMEKNKGVSARSKKGETRGSSGKPRIDEPQTLADIGINKTQSHRWQKLAAIPEPEFEKKVEAAKKKAVSSLDNMQSSKRKQTKAPKVTITASPATNGKIKTLDDWIGDLIVELTNAAATLPAEDKPEFFAALREAIANLEKN